MTPSLSRVHNRASHSGTWIIYDADSGELWSTESTTILWSRPRQKDEDTGEHAWPADMRQEYERLLGKSEFMPLAETSTVNLVELVAGEDCAFDQKCAHGHRVEQHAVYCHNEQWLYAPRKCRRGEWLASVYGGEPSDYAHEKCPGFLANPAYQPEDQA